MNKSVIAGASAKSTLDSSGQSLKPSPVVGESGAAMPGNELSSLNRELQKPPVVNMESSNLSGTKTSGQSPSTSSPCDSLEKSLESMVSTTHTLGYIPPEEERVLSGRIVVNIFKDNVFEIKMFGQVSRKQINEWVVRGLQRCLRIHREQTMRAFEEKES